MFHRACFTSFIALLASLPLAACADSAPRVSGAEAVTVFSYDSAEAMPNVRLAVFACVDSDVRRVDSIQLLPPDGEYDWTLREPLTIMGRKDDKNGMWAGGTSFVMPNGETFPSGVYRVKYTDAGGEEVVCFVTVEGGEEMASLDAQAVGKMDKDNAQEKVAVYDQSGVLLYYGEKKNEWKAQGAAAELWQDIEGAAEMRECVVLKGGAIICLLPPQYKMPLQGAQNSSDASEATQETLAGDTGE